MTADPPDRKTAARSRRQDPPATPPNVDMLTNSEIQSLRQRAKENGAFFKKAFSHLRPKPEKPER